MSIALLKVPQSSTLGTPPLWLTCSRGCRACALKRCPLQPCLRSGAVSLMVFVRHASQEEVTSLTNPGLDCSADFRAAVKQTPTHLDPSPRGSSSSCCHAGLISSFLKKSTGKAFGWRPISMSPTTTKSHVHSFPTPFSLCVRELQAVQALLSSAVNQSALKLNVPSLTSLCADHRRSLAPQTR